MDGEGGESVRHLARDNSVRVAHSCTKFVRVIRQRYRRYFALVVNRRGSR